MRNEWPTSRFNEENAQKALNSLLQFKDLDLVKWTILRKYAEVKQLFFSTDSGVVNRAIGKLEELEWVLELLGMPLYDGLPLADGTPDTENVDATELLSAKIGGGYPDSFRQSTLVVNPRVASGS